MSEQQQAIARMHKYFRQMEQSNKEIAARIQGQFFAGKRSAYQDASEQIEVIARLFFDLELLTLKTPDNVE